MLPRWIRWLAIAVVSGVIFYASVLDAPTSGSPSLGPFGVFGLDKWLHALAYAGLGATAVYAFVVDRELVQAAVFAFVVAVAYGVFIEFVQAPLPARYFSVADMLADTVGAALGTVAVAGLFTVQERVRRPAAERA